MKTRYVYLGRFSPFHRGHQIVLEKLMGEYGQDNVLVIVGSSNCYNSRTPYTFEERKEMIQTIFPEIEVLPLPDGNPNLVNFDGTTNDIWLQSIKKIEKEMGVKFIFFGGNEEDLEVLAKKFETRIILDRKMILEGISATKIREAIEINDIDFLRRFLDSRVLPLAVTSYKKFLNNSKL